MLTKLVAEMSEPDRADLMQRRERPLRVPPVVGELSEAGDLGKAMGGIGGPPSSPVKVP